MEYDKLHLLHETSLKDSESVLRAKLDELRAELDAKWKDSLRLETLFLFLFAS